jgi:hypothetical protein
MLRHSSGQSTTGVVACRPALILLIGFLVVAGIPGLANLSVPFAHQPAVTTPTPAHHGIAADARSPTTPSAVSSPGPPAGGPPSLSFWGSNSTFSDLPGTSQACTRSNTGTSHTSYCYSQSQNPTIVDLANGDIGVGYSVFTNRSATACAGSAVNTFTRVGFATSHDGGHHFGTFSYIGNDTCSYLQATEPSFSVSGSGALFTAFVEENKSTAKVPVLPPSYTSRTVDALGFSSSSNNGATWRTVVSLNTSGNITKPVIASFGSTVYIVYENTSNGSTTYPGGSSSGSFHALELEFLRSTDGGLHWTGPSTLPGENASMGYWSVAPSVAVNATGLLAVSYATNRSCVFGCAAAGSARYADDIVVITSKTNGSTWSPIHRIHAAVGESHCWSGYNGLTTCYTAPFEWTPQTSLSFSKNGTNLFAAWAGSYSVPGAAANSASFIHSGVFAAAGTSAAVRWKASTIQANTNGYPSNEFYLPAIGVGPNGTVYLTYTEENITNCNGCSGLNGAFSQWVVSSPDGVSWTEPSFVTAVIKATPATTYLSWNGWVSSVAFTPAGVPLLGFSLPRPTHSTTQTAGSNAYYNTSYPTNLSVAYPYSGPTVSITVTENGLAPGAAWSFSIDGSPFNQTTKAVVVSGIPVNTTVLIDTQRLLPGYWTQIASSLSVPNSAMFSRPTTVYFNFTELFGFQLIYATVNAPQLYISFVYNGTTYYDDEYRYCYSNGYCYGNHYFSPAFPWYFPAGTVLSLIPNAVPLVGYWNGTGNGSYTGTGADANVTMDAPINETAWAIAAGIYNETFNPTGLPSTSVFSFKLGQKSYSAPASGSENVSGLVTGAYGLSAIQANSSALGWEYFGVSSVGSTVVIPAEPIVNLSFADVDVAAATGPVSFHAQGFTNGTVWDLTFNGTTYSSSTPWINVTTHPGTYPWAVGAAIISSNDSVGYTPSPVPSRIAVTPGTPVDVAFLPAYRVQVFAGVGGSVTGGGVHWLAHGATATYNATPNAGYSFVEWSGVGAGNYTGTSPSALVSADGPLVQTASFAPLPTDRFNATFTGNGLAPGTWWSVFLNGIGYSTDQANLTVGGLYSCSAGPAGTYSLLIPYAYSNDSTLSRFVPGHYVGRFCLNGIPPPDVIQFTAQYLVSVQATAGGTVALTVGNNQSSSGLWASSTDFVQVEAFPAPGFQFVNWTGTGSGSFTGASSVSTISPSGSVTELATFVPIPTKVTSLYSVHFALTTPLAPGTVWNLTLGGVGYSSDSGFLNLTGFAANGYPLSIGVTHSPDNLTRYTPLSPPTQVSVKANTTIAISYGRAFWVAVSGVAGGIVSGANGWIAASGAVSINATPNPGYLFEGWNGTGPGNYTGSSSATVLTVTGPVREVAVFVPVAPVATQGTSVWQNPGLWAALLLAGVIGGVAVGSLLSRRARGSAPPDPGSSGPAPAEELPPEYAPEGNPSDVSDLPNGEAP